MAHYNKMPNVDKDEESKADANQDSNSGCCLLQGGNFPFKSLWITLPQL